jgi:hypothetical protein
VVWALPIPSQFLAFLYAVLFFKDLVIAIGAIIEVKQGPFTNTFIRSIMTAVYGSNSIPRGLYVLCICFVNK